MKITSIRSSPLNAIQLELAYPLQAPYPIRLRWQSNHKILRSLEQWIVD